MQTYDSVTACRSVYLDLSSIRRESVGGILRGDTALESKSTSGDMVLRQAKLLERGACSNLDLRSDNVDTSDFLGDGVLDLTR